ncbi:hypothetical protein [Actinoplanes sp. NPDC049681]|uniref:hypothetical protein n=1 Tax=Actinoplanes sp. NPDC049681 TaxID=3363905 RepID=UPI003799C979
MPDGDEVTNPPAAPVFPHAAPFIPSQRAPHPSEAGSGFASPTFPAGAGPASGFPGGGVAPGPPAGVVPGFVEPRRGPGRGLLVGGALALVAALAVGAGAVYVANREPLGAEAAVPPAHALPLTPFEQVNALLKAQATALVRGDEKGWLAAVDPAQPKLRTRYRSMFRSLRGLGVSYFEYKTYVRAQRKDRSGRLSVGADVAYCYADDNCVVEKGPDSDGPPTVAQELDLRSVKGGWVITALTARKNPADEQLAPWATSDLVTAKGKRVTLVAGPGEQKYFRRLLPIADRAATVNDRFAGLVGNPQKRYRIYLAGPRQWKTWYGGMTDKWIVGYALPLHESGTDVVLNMAELKDDDRFLATTVQHELGHVVTVGGVHRRTYGGAGTMWLKEGIAEYIGWYPQPATASWRRQAVREAVHGSRRPTSIAMKSLGPDARSQEGDAFYGLGHFAADCIATKYGQRALFTFVRLYLREDRDLDPASQEAFGRPFKSVDRTCVAWIRDRA